MALSRLQWPERRRDEPMDRVTCVGAEEKRGRKWRDGLFRVEEQSEVELLRRTEDGGAVGERELVAAPKAACVVLY